MTQRLILNIPHSSSQIPFMDGFIVSKPELKKEILKLTDWHTEDLFQSKDAISVVVKFSRIFCDPERFVNDEEEVMANSGMGVLYTKTDDGRLMRKVTSELREWIIKENYEPHHAKLNQAVKEQLEQHGKALIVDCHSFCDTPFERDRDKSPNRPDICLGTDKYHTSEKLLNFSIGYFENKGLSVGVDTPYKGTIVPMEYYGKDNRVQSIMVEVNRKLYLKEGTNKKSNNYNSIKAVIKEYFSDVQKEFL